MHNLVDKLGFSHALRIHFRHAVLYDVPGFKFVTSTLSIIGLATWLTTLPPATELVATPAELMTTPVADLMGTTELDWAGAAGAETQATLHYVWLWSFAALFNELHSAAPLDEVRPSIRTLRCSCVV